MPRYTCRHSEKIISHIHSGDFHVILRFSSLPRFFFSSVLFESVSEILFYVFLFTAPLLKSWKMKMNTNFLHRVFQSFFVIRQKNVLFEFELVGGARENAERSESAWRMCSYDVCRSMMGADGDILNYTYVKFKFNGNKYN